MIVTRQQLLIDINNIIKEDTEWWRRVRKRDKKNLRVLIGHGKKSNRKKSYVKKGGPYTKDPPKYSGIKAGPGLGLLEESTTEANTRFKGFLDSAKPGDKLEFKVKKPIERFWFIDYFTPGKKYVATIRPDNKVSVTTDRGLKDKTKKELMEALFAKGPICDVLDCEQSYATIGGERVALCKFLGKCKSDTGFKITPDTPLEPGQKSIIATKLTNKYLPKAKPGFIEKVAAAVGGQKLIKTIKDIIEFFKKLFDKISDMFGMSTPGHGSLQKTIMGTMGSTSLNNIAAGNGKTIMYIGNSQTSAVGRGAFGSWAQGKGYKRPPNKNKYSFTGSGGTANGYPTHWIDHPSLEKLLTDEKDKIGLAIICLGDSQNKSWDTDAGKLVNYLRKKIPGISVLWVGAPPIQKWSTKYSHKRNPSRIKTNEKIKSASKTNNFTFIDPFEYLTNNELKSSYSDGLHMSHAGAGRLLSKTLSGHQPGQGVTQVAAGPVANQIKKLSASQRNIAAIIEREFMTAGLPASIAAAAIVNAHSESGLKPLAVGDGGSAVGLFGCHKNGAAAYLKRDKKYKDAFTETRRRFQEYKKNHGHPGYGARMLALGGDIYKNNPNDIRFDPVANTKIILRVVLGSFGTKLRQRAKQGADIAELAAIFSRDVERPAAEAEQMASRSSKAKRWFA